jgi:hypothetical protein
MDVDQIPTETDKPTHAERERIERDAGYIVARIDGGGDFDVKAGFATGGGACLWARRFAAASPGSRFGVFKLAREFVAEATADTLETM